MKKVVSTVLALILCSVFLFSYGFATTSDNQFKLTVNDNNVAVKYGVSPTVINDVVYVPAREALETFDADIKWNGETRSVDIKLNDVSVEVKINSNIVKVNSRPCTLEGKVIIKDSRTLLPLSFFSTVFGINIDIDESTKTLNVSTNIVDKDNVDININYLGGPSAVSLIKMLKDNPYLGKNVNANYEMLKQVSLIQANMLNKKADFIVAPTNLGANIYNKTEGEYVLADVYSWGVLHLSSTEDIKGWSDLKDKEIYLIGKTGTPGIVFSNLLQLNGLDINKDVKLVYLNSPQELATYMITGKATTAVLPEPVQTQVLMKNKNVKVVMNIQEEWAKKYDNDLGFPQSSIFVKKELADAHPEIVKAFLREHKGSIEWVNMNKEQAGIKGQELGIMPNAKIIENSIPRCNLKYMDAKDAKKATEEFLKILLDFNPKSIGDKLPDEGFYYEN
ncbi:stalk domain-containing protein [Abyssisolibacter fermentans]|uniref:stalk domain-containing protein n=1 Tax=Abyssisolibacter fermentans TaxID=1766203 RepID=UPI00082ED626|nr:stalk domain-containing protein [Abyssisolibacter fermentans]